MEILKNMPEGDGFDSGSAFTNLQTIIATDPRTYGTNTGSALEVVGRGLQAIFIQNGSENLLQIRYWRDIEVNISYSLTKSNLSGIDHYWLKSDDEDGKPESLSDEDSAKLTQEIIDHFKVNNII